MRKRFFRVSSNSQEIQSEDRLFIFALLFLSLAIDFFEARGVSPKVSSCIR
ncbi:uncharacterized protein PHALS_00452 [Plasmopara halstedii]|uniref:Uncharacterized protein n=1 Tax=Plasmopara halstedii TaxID=4781 RepID=A0A0P1A7X9_PLAHL|nr:uncharacterized protein PHALS_00452 [Plasmopara halstedii]CEG36134.1 hypothetical protein PHALS_00452 [Plasmopara halstedii]|eukprot:XP_024572503.1 hypothetical protein PHALS_00452 [Plasmopara halstedii]